MSYLEKIDPITFEVLRHRLWAINDEAAANLKVISGSPVATESFDFNTSILNARGEAFVIGPYIASHAIGQGIIVRYILAEYGDNPGIGEGDMFLCNNPYMGALHQNDVTVVAPVHWQGELIAWTGATIHQVDVGGASKGSQASLGAQSIFEEAPPIPPIKIVEKGTIRRDLELEYLLRSRTRDLNALDLRAKIASNSVAKRRIGELVERYGLETVKATMEGIVEYTATLLKAKLRELPDGVWRHVSYIDFENRIYSCRATMTKSGDSLTFDYRETDAQAPAVINCAYSGLEAGILAGVLPLLCCDIPWSPAGVLKAVEILSRPGTVVHAEWPAGVCKATTAGSFMATNLATACLAKMLAASPDHRDHAMALWIGATPVQELFGVDHRGEPFGATILDGMAGGAGARTYRDGVDTGGFIRSLSCVIANVETYEYRYPILYLCRRQEMDTGGAGKFRGGVGISMKYIPHDVDQLATSIMHSFGVEQPTSAGLSGGYPGGTNQYLLLRDSNVHTLLADGLLPVELEEMKGQLEVLPAASERSINRGDVYACFTSGGGGYGDPLLRDPQLVWSDVQNGLVSSRAASGMYGVFLGADGIVDQALTGELRQQIRQQRIAREV